MNAKIWIILCLAFGAYNLKQLFDEYYSLNYMIVEEDGHLYDKHTNYMVCTPFKEIGANNELKFRPPVLRNVTPAVLLNYSILSIEEKLKHRNLFRLNESFISRENVCFLVTKPDLESSPIINKFIHNYQPILFMFSDTMRPFFYEYIFYENKLNDVKTFYLKVQRQKVYALQYLTRPICFKLENQFALNRFNCLNECFIRFRLTIGLYSAEDSGSFDLKEIVNDHSLPQPSGGKVVKRSASTSKPKEIKLIRSLFLLQGISRNFELCLKKCSSVQSCSYEIYNAVRIRRFYYQNYISKQNIEKIDLQSYTYVAYYSVSDFFLQFFGLFTLFTNTSVFDFTCFCIVSLAKRLSNYSEQCFSPILPFLKLLVLALSMTFVCVQSTLMVQDYLWKSAYPNRTSVLKFTAEFEPFSIVVCFPVETIIYHKDDLEGGRNYRFVHHDELIRSLSFEELKSQTDKAMDIKVRDLLLYYGFYSKPFNWTTRNNVIFKNITCASKPTNDQPCLSRCFWIDIFLEETRYDLLLPTNSLFMNFSTSHWHVYLIDKDQPFTSMLNVFKGEFYVSKLVREHSSTSKKSNCRNYQEDAELNCLNRRNCIDKCVTRRYLERHSALPLFATLDMNDLNLTDYRKRFTADRDQEIEEHCSTLFAKPDCHEVYFIENPKTSYAFYEFKITINLNFEKIIEKELQVSLLKVLLDVLSLQSIFFSTNVAALLLALFSFLKFAFKLRWHKVYQLPIIFICFFGFFLHNVVTFYGIINESLIEDGTFEKLDNLKLPNAIFCFEFDDKGIDANHKLTRSYLDDYTSELSYERIFDFVWYFNGTHRNLFNPQESGTSNSEMEITYFYYLNMKCYEFELKVLFSEKDFYFLPTRNLLGIYFNPEFAERVYESKIIYFLYRKDRTSKQFSNSFYYLIKTGKYNVTYEVTYEPFKITRLDHFQSLKDLRKLFFKSNQLHDATAYLENLITTFRRRYSLATKEVLLEDYGDDSLEIDDDLFKQLYKEQNKTDQESPVDVNFRQNLYNAHNQYNDNPYKKNGFLFAVSLNGRKSKISNSENWSKLIVNLLTSMMLWLNTGILEIHTYIETFMSIVTLEFQSHVIIRFLTNLKNCLQNTCKCRVSPIRVSDAS